MWTGESEVETKILETGVLAWIKSKHVLKIPCLQYVVLY